MSIYYADKSVTLHHGDCLAVLRADALGYDYRLGYFPPAIESRISRRRDPVRAIELAGEDMGLFGEGIA